MHNGRLRQTMDRVWRLRQRPFGEVLDLVSRRALRQLRAWYECSTGRTLVAHAGPRQLFAALQPLEGSLPTGRPRGSLANRLVTLHQYVTQVRQPLFPAIAEAEFGRRFRASYPEAARRITARADEALAHRFDLLGSGPIEYGALIDWHVNPVAGTRWTRRPSHCLDVLGLGQPFDVKRPWELSRQQYLPLLGYAYLLTADERYAREAVLLMTTWIEANPPGIGINWLVPMELALRCFSWLLTLDCLRTSPSLTPVALGTVLASLLAQTRYIAKYPEKSPVAGNHYVANGFGLVMVALAFPCFREAKRWFTQGMHILSTEIVRQVYPDGVDYEQSTDYHRFVGEMYGLAATTLVLHRQRLPDQYAQRLERMVTFSRDMTGPDGLVPQLADSDDGFVVRLSERLAEDHRLLLGLGTVLYGRGDFRALAGTYPPDLCLLLGERGRERYEAATGTPDPGSSRAYPDGGYYILRDGRDPAAFFSVIDCGHLGMGPGQYGGHGHADTLSFVCAAFGTPLLVNPGTFTYTGSVEWRDYFRSTRAHNGLTIDGYGVADLAGTWSMVNRCWPQTLGWGTGASLTVFDGLHTGFQRLPSPIIHRRRLALRHGGYWVVLDTVTGSGRHTIERSFHLPPGAEARLCGSDVVAQLPGGVVLTLAFGAAAQGAGGGVPPTITLEQSWYSPRYGVRERNTVVRVRDDALLPVLLPAVIVPVQTAAAQVRFALATTAAAIALTIDSDRYAETIHVTGSPWTAEDATNLWELRTGPDRCEALSLHQTHHSQPQDTSS